MLGKGGIWLLDVTLVVFDLVLHFLVNLISYTRGMPCMWFI